MKPEKAKEIVDELFSLYDQYGSTDYIGEEVSQLEHMGQAAQLAQEEGFEEEVILAAFFHDIGHLYEHVMASVSMDGYGVADHELIAGNYLRDLGFSEKIARLVEMHVQTKRYLTYRFDDYYDRLSEASKKTLTFQGGVMTVDEAKVFEKDDLFVLHLKIREWDDKAKLQNLPSADPTAYRMMAFRHLLSQN